MRGSVILFCLLSVTALVGCDLRSETAKKEMENFSGTPTPTFAPVPTDAPVDPADVVNVDVSLSGDLLSVDGDGQKKSVTCTKLNRVTINGNNSVVTVKGPCRQIMINGDNDQVTSDAVMEFVVNGGNNTVKYSRYVNGKRPVITENSPGNDIEKIAAPGVKH